MIQEESTFNSDISLKLMGLVLFCIDTDALILKETWSIIMLTIDPMINTEEFWKTQTETVEIHKGPSYKSLVNCYSTIECI